MAQLSHFALDLLKAIEQHRVRFIFEVGRLGHGADLACVLN
jgi:hypothetical protein